MRYLLDTHLLVWAAVAPRRLSADMRKILTTQPDGLLFSVASLWELAIKYALGRRDYDVDPRLLRRGLLDNGYSELVVLADHVFAVATLPRIHRDPFDRLLIVQAAVEGATLLTSDPVVARYPGAIRKV